MWGLLCARPCLQKRNQGRAQDRPSTPRRQLGERAPKGTPRLDTGRSPGLQVGARGPTSISPSQTAPPARANNWFSGWAPKGPRNAAPAYRCGGSQGLRRCAGTLFPFHLP